MLEHAATGNFRLQELTEFPYGACRASALQMRWGLPDYKPSKFIIPHNPKAFKVLRFLLLFCLFLKECGIYEIAHGGMSSIAEDRITPVCSIEAENSPDAWHPRLYRHKRGGGNFSPRYYALLCPIFTLFFITRIDESSEHDKI